MRGKALAWRTALGAVLLLAILRLSFGGGGSGDDWFYSSSLVTVGVAVLVGLIWLMTRMGKLGWTIFLVTFGLVMAGGLSRGMDGAGWVSYTLFNLFFYGAVGALVGGAWNGLNGLDRRRVARIERERASEEDEAAERPAMQTLTPILRAPYQPPRYDEDERRIVAVCAAAGYDVSQDDAFRIWGDRSESWSASWLRLPDEDGELLEWVLKFGVV